MLATLREGDGTELQAMFSLDKVGTEILEQWKSDIDLGDLVSVTGEIITSKRGELSILADSFQLAAKSLRTIACRTQTSFRGDASSDALCRFDCTSRGAI